MENNKENIKKLMDLLNLEVRTDNEEEQLADWALLMNGQQDGFGDKFVDDTMFKIGNNLKNALEVDFSGKVVQMFRRVALSGAAAILLLLSYTYVSEGTLSPDSLLGISEINEVSVDITSNLLENF